jgi:hypothetical protein
MKLRIMKSRRVTKKKKKRKRKRRSRLMKKRVSLCRRRNLVKSKTIMGTMNLTNHESPVKFRITTATNLINKKSPVKSRITTATMINKKSQVKSRITTATMINKKNPVKSRIPTGKKSQARSRTTTVTQNRPKTLSHKSKAVHPAIITPNQTNNNMPNSTGPHTKTKPT